jgi:hypothetical protein
MPVPTQATYSAAALQAAHQSFANLVDSGAGAGSIKVRSSADVLLAQVPLDDPCGSVSGVTGALTLDIAGPDLSADATGVAAYGEICDSNGNVYLALPAQSGNVAVPGYLVLNTLNIVAGGPVYVVSAVIG